MSTSELDGTAYELLLPRPAQCTLLGGRSDWPREVALEGEERLAEPARAWLREALADAGHVVRAEAAFRVAFGEASGSGAAESYGLELRADGVVVRGADAEGLFRGATTLVQLIRLSERDDRVSWPCLAIEEAPRFGVRGAMLDVSRDRVPTMETLRHVVDLLASWKVNQLQLYVEHTFAYANHEEVWRDVSPLTADEVRALDRYCAERHVELVPNQQSFGHLHHWLRLPRYRDLAECPDGVAHPFSHEREPFSLNPLDPRSLTFLGELYDELLPCFRSRELQVGLDETFDLGLGRSRAACEERGTGRVYLDYLNAVAALVRERGHRMHFWADIILNHPELVPELPRDVIPNLWGYEASHPFEEQCQALAASGLDFLVCPGTSSWQSIAGRLANMQCNVTAAATNAARFGAKGLLVTDWGDRGHLQPLPASYPGWLTAAEQAWSAEAPARSPDTLARLLSAHAFGGVDGDEGNLGRALVSLAQASEATGTEVANASPLSILLTKAPEPALPEELADLSAEGLSASAAKIESARRELAAIPEAPQTMELTWMADTLAFACRLGEARLATPGPASALPSGVRTSLTEGVNDLATRHRSLWLARSRPGGLARSRAWLDRIAEALQACAGA